MTSRDRRTRMNHAWWDERAKLHRETPLYQAHIDRLKRGGLSLLPLEVNELGDIRGKKVLHLQCHIGTDTLSLARLGARVTGVDFSNAAIEEARRLSADLDIEATFETCEITALSSRFPASFDLVFTSHGVLSWLPDLEAWAHHIAGCLIPSGQLYLSEGHPLVWAFAAEGAVQQAGLKLELPYLSQPEPSSFSDSGSYADRALPTQANATVEWSWGLGDVVNALIGAGLVIDHLNEHPVGFYPATPEFHEGPDGHYRLPEPLDGSFPLTFTIRATKPARSALKPD